MYIKSSIQTRIEETSQEYHASTSTPIIPRVAIASDIDITGINSLDWADENIESHELSTVSLSCENIELHKLETVKDLVIKNSPMEIMTNEIDGLRIVDMSHIFFQIQNIKHDSGFDCNFMNMKFKKKLVLLKSYPMKIGPSIKLL
ncbi:uncharacterized protein LOC111026879 [Myzus persicae]|uniref:uncharacterized protein LOC111026879 n=1 Tax=Myzus persicae TaxID=13164 RepID=UPI000B930B8B|nr:uncharacterized protein LOC111026879 [Myzus persicae]